MVIIKKILVATDFSELSGSALAYGRDLARTYGAQLHVLHVVEDVLVQYPMEIAAAYPELRQQLQDKARAELAARMTADDRASLRAVVAVETAANAAAGVCHYAKQNGVDLIITGTHGRGAIKQLFLGSVAERVVRHAPCPVLTVHAREREFIVPDAEAIAVGT